MVRALGGMLAAIAFVVIAMAATGWFGPIEPAPLSRTPSTRPTTTTSRTTASTQATPSAGASSLTLTESQLTDEARRYTPLTVSGITVTDPTVTLESGHLRLTATGRAFLVSGPVVVVASPTISNGVAGARIDSATFAGFALPDATKESIAQTFSDVLRANIPAGVRVTSITVGAGTLVVETQRA